MIKRLGFLILSAAFLLPAQQSTESHLRTRQLWDTTLLDKRPSAAKMPAAKKPALSAVKGALVGITLWRLRPSQPGDETAMRALIHEESGDVQWTPERVAAATPLAEGQRVRISAEAAQEGYLYIIDRDEYADGTKSQPTMIFPTLRTRGSDNHVTPGLLVEIPAQDDTPPYFKVHRTRADQVGEVLTFLITPQPLAGVTIGQKPLKLPESQVAGWEKQWKAKSTKLEGTAQAGKVYTVAEKLAARGEKLLTKSDPLPQTMYHVDCKPGDPVMLDVKLTIAQ